MGALQTSGVEGSETPAEYDSQRYLCSDCADESDCGGIMRATATDVGKLNRIGRYDPSPHFELGRKMKSVGGSAKDVAMSFRQKLVDQAACEQLHTLAARGHVQIERDAIFLAVVFESEAEHERGTSA